jgi:ABC-2 type transport system ATP-binding protein
MEWCIETVDLTRVFGDFTAVDRLTLRVRRGAFYGFLGPNGAGKSTTIKILTGLLAPTSGEMRVFGTEFRKDPVAVKRRVGVVPESLCLFENLTAREYLAFIGRMYGMERPVVAGRTEELLDLMGLADTRKTLVLEFSHGMKKKLALAAALIHDPELLFLDEPFEGIDAIASRTIRSVLERLVRRDVTVFLTSHILEIVERLCTDVGIIHKGKLVHESVRGDWSEPGALERAFIGAVGANETETGANLSWMGDSV